MNLAIRQTSDGSHTICNLDLNETYHSVHGAVYESIHVFIKAGLEFVLQQQKVNVLIPCINTLEIGFGTGLNALLSVQKALETPFEMHYTSIEPFPVPMEVVHQLNYAQYLDQPEAAQQLLLKIHTMGWEEEKEIIPNFYLRKVQATLADFEALSQAYHLIYFDPFPPNAQPDLWTSVALAKLVGMLAPEGVFTTYGAKGQFKRDLKALGMEVQSLPGPPGKREMTRAIKL